MRIDNDAHVGKMMIGISVDSTCPLVRCVVEPGTDPIQLVAELNAVVREFLERKCVATEFTADLLQRDGIFVAKWSEPVKSRADAKAEQEQALKSLGEAWREMDEKRRAAAESNPDNGKRGRWHVCGIRHDTYVTASSEPEAVKLAIDSGEVGDWESPTAGYVGGQ